MKGKFLHVKEEKGELNKYVDVISMPIMEEFDKQTKKYRKSILNKGYSKTISLEMGTTYGWGKYARYNFGIDEFGKSGKASEVIKSFGFDVENITNKIYKIIK